MKKEKISKTDIRAEIRSIESALSGKRLKIWKTSSKEEKIQLARRSILKRKYRQKDSTILKEVETDD